MKKIIYFLLLLIVSVAFVYGEASPWEPQEKPLTKISKKIAQAKKIDEFTSILNEAYQTFCKPSEDAAPDMFAKAHSAVATAGTVITKKPKSPEVAELFSACSLKTVCAVLQMAQEKYDRDLKALMRKRIDALEEIKQIHEQINDVERSKATEMANKLKSDIEAMKSEADKKFKELQSSLIQVSNDARGTIISMSDILFETGKANLTSDLKTSLAKIAGILLVFKNSRVIVEGHTDNVGSEEYNQGLSEKRAMNVMNFLIEQGVTQARLTAIGYGLSRPIADNETKEGRAKNRRVDLIVQEKEG